MRDDEGNMIKNAHLIGTMKRILKLLFHRIRPVFVFDGATPQLKIQTVKARRSIRQKQEVSKRTTAQRIYLSKIKQQAIQDKLKKSMPPIINNAENYASTFCPAPSQSKQHNTHQKDQSWPNSRCMVRVQLDDDTVIIGRVIADGVPADALRSIGLIGIETTDGHSIEVPYPNESITVIDQKPTSNISDSIMGKANSSSNSTSSSTNNTNPLEDIPKQTNLKPFDVNNLGSENEVISMSQWPSDMNKCEWLNRSQTLIGKRLSKNTGKSIGFENTDSMEDGDGLVNYVDDNGDDVYLDNDDDVQWVEGHENLRVKKKRKNREDNDDDDYSDDDSDEDVHWQTPNDSADINIEVLGALPPHLRKNMIEDLRKKERKRSRSTFMPVASNPTLYSQTQLANFLSGSKLNKRISEVQKHVDGKEEGRNIVGEEGRSYVLTGPSDANFSGSGGFSMDDKDKAISASISRKRVIIDEEEEGDNRDGRLDEFGDEKRSSGGFFTEEDPQQENQWEETLNDLTYTVPSSGPSSSSSSFIKERSSHKEPSSKEPSSPSSSSSSSSTRERPFSKEPSSSSSSSSSSPTRERSPLKEPSSSSSSSTIMDIATKQSKSVSFGVTKLYENKKESKHDNTINSGSNSISSGINCIDSGENNVNSGKNSISSAGFIPSHTFGTFEPSQSSSNSGHSEITKMTVKDDKVIVIDDDDDDVAWESDSADGNRKDDKKDEYDTENRIDDDGGPSDDEAQFRDNLRDTQLLSDLNEENHPGNSLQRSLPLYTSSNIGQGNDKKGSDVDRVAATASRMADWAKHAIRRAFRDHEAQNKSSENNGGNQNDNQINNEQNNQTRNKDYDISLAQNDNDIIGIDDSMSRQSQDVDAQVIAQLLHDDENGISGKDGNMSNSSNNNSSSSSSSTYVRDGSSSSSSHTSGKYNDQNGNKSTSLLSQRLPSMQIISNLATSDINTIPTIVTTPAVTTNGTIPIISYNPDNTSNLLLSTKEEISTVEDPSITEEPYGSNEPGSLPITTLQFARVNEFSLPIVPSVVLDEILTVEDPSIVEKPYGSNDPDSLSTITLGISSSDTYGKKDIEDGNNDDTYVEDPSLAEIPYDSNEPDSLPIIISSNKLGIPSSDTYRKNDIEEGNTYGKNDTKEGNNDEVIHDMDILDDSCNFANKDLKNSEIKNTASQKTSSNIDDINVVENILVVGENSDEFTDIKVQKGSINVLSHIDLIPDGFNDDMGTNIPNGALEGTHSAVNGDIEYGLDMDASDSISISQNGISSTNDMSTSISSIPKDKALNLEGMEEENKKAETRGVDSDESLGGENDQLQLKDLNLEVIEEKNKNDDEYFRPQVIVPVPRLPDGYADLTQDDIDAFEKDEENDRNDQLIESTDHTEELSSDELKRLLRDEEAEEGQARRVRNVAARDAESMTEEMKMEVIALLEAFGLPYVIAPYEAEAQCAVLESLGLVDGVVTDDSDAFLFGAKSVYKNIFSDKKFVEAYLAEDIKRELGLHREELVALAYFLGCDYTDGVTGVGIVNALEIVQAFPMRADSGSGSIVDEKKENDKTDPKKDKTDPIIGLNKFKEWLEGYDFADIIASKQAPKSKGKKGEGIKNKKDNSKDKDKDNDKDRDGINDDVTNEPIECKNSKSARKSIKIQKVKKDENGNESEEMSASDSDYEECNNEKNNAVVNKKNINMNNKNNNDDEITVDSLDSSIAEHIDDNPTTLVLPDLESRLILFSKAHRSARGRWDLKPNFPDIRVAEAFMNPAANFDPTVFEWPLPKLHRVRSYCREQLGWTEQEMDQQVDTVIQRYASRAASQPRIDSFFMTYHDGNRAAKFRSTRLGAAVQQVTGKRTELSVPGQTAGKRIGTKNSKKSKKEILDDVGEVEKKVEKKGRKKSEKSVSKKKNMKSPADEAEDVEVVIPSLLPGSSSSPLSTAPSVSPSLNKDQHGITEYNSNTDINNDDDDDDDDDDNFFFKTKKNKTNKTKNQKAKKSQKLGEK
eukprot:CAMPEP_0119038400 /NCGR_PEP_ID=MMETSP1177-20130426/7320_1 /TAXON_ID=2985 /ORGANISM="Ochromonas sp, Strain CCMP1899" /LENGTH=1991 /DNA_ID=CAMNT_0007000961 /DNA_START=161 /DNA_END=6136 /DNA_ORIENTATION=+